MLVTTPAPEVEGRKAVEEKMVASWKPTREQVQAADGKTLPDVMEPGLCVLFCGINPGLYSAAVGHHFARPGNRFWKALHQAGFTDREMSPFEDRELLRWGYGLTNIVERATATAGELAAEELVQGRQRLEVKVRRTRPGVVAILGITAYRKAFRQRKARVGEQRQLLAGARLWVLPNPSGLNTHYRLNDLARVYAELRAAVAG
jgi:TDG/mug DNA glycosylase family protein